MVEQRFDDFPIYEFQNDWPLVDQCDISAQGRHERRVFETYDTCADHNDFFWHATQAREVVCIHNTMIIKGNLWAVRRARTTGNEDLLSFHFNPFTLALNFHGMRL